MTALRATLDRLLERQHLSEAESFELMHALTDVDLPPAMGGALLAALRAKGVTPEELRGFASAMRKLARRPILPDGSPLVDMVGTGGDASGSLNLSTGAALLVASLGIRVSKHGTTSISSRSGSADVIRALGVPLPLDEHAAGACLAATNFTFFFAPHYHPAMKAIMPVRQALGVRTVFNILGPLSNPAEPPFHLIGAFNEETAALMADALSGMPLERAYVVHGEPGWDEATPIGPFVVFDVRRGAVSRHVRDAGEFGIPRCQAEDLRGGDATYNAGRLRAALRGEEQGPHRDTLVLQAALVLELMGLEKDPVTAARRAADAIDDGRAAQILERLAAFSASHASATTA
jgi:anthranilate phosphoribosyltransferase